MHCISDSGFGGKLPDSEVDSLLIYCVLFCNLSDFHCISTLSIRYMRSVFMSSISVCVVICYYVHAK